MTDATRPRRHRSRTRSHYRDPLSALTVAAVAYLATLLILLLLVPQLAVLGLPTWGAQLLAFLLAWAPLIAGVLIAGSRYGSRSLGDDAGLRIRWIDLGTGLLVGLVIRFLVEALAPAASGTALDGRAVPPAADLVVLVVGAALIAPVVEELFFRGLLQRSVSGLVVGGRAARIVVSVLVSTPLFVLLHLVSAAPALWGAVAVTTGVSGLAFGLLAATTRRLGASITAHVVFNGLGLVMTYLR
jgi:membrane protease YdiL (CAAX protease family)